MSAVVEALSSTAMAIALVAGLTGALLWLAIGLVFREFSGRRPGGVESPKAAVAT